MVLAAKADTKTVILAIIVVAIMAFPIAAFVGLGNNSSNDGDSLAPSTITYVDPTGTNPDVSVDYYGIPATEYNPLYWDYDSDTWTVDDGDNDKSNDEANSIWIEPTADTSAKMGGAKILVTYTVQYVQDNGDDKIIINGVEKTLATWKSGSKTDPTDPTKTAARDITVIMPAGVTVRNNPGTSSDSEYLNPVAMVSYRTSDPDTTFASTGKNEDRFYIGNNDANHRFSITYHYHGEVGKIYLRVNQMGGSNDNVKQIKTNGETEGNRTVYDQITCGFYVDVNLSGQSMDDTLVTKQVFGGWRDGSGNIIYPGDVVNKNVGTLYANWIYPDVQMESDILTFPATSGESYTLTAPTDGQWRKNARYVYEMDIADFSESISTSSLYHPEYDEVNGKWVYKAGGSGSMFGFTYYLNPVTQEHPDNVIEVDTSYLYAGTYRSKYTNNPVTISLKDDTTTVGTMIMNGDVVIDNVKLRQDVSHGDRLANSNGIKLSINANNNRLILGTGIETVKTNVTASYTNTLLYAPVVYGGGTSNKVIDSSKQIVSGLDEEWSTAKIGTFVIVHSGVYAHILGGGSTSNSTSTYMVIKKATAIGVVAGTGGNMPVTSGGTTDQSYHQGGTFIYAYDLKMVGDKYEDVATGATSDPDIAKGHQWQVDESSMLQGAAYLGTVYGSTHIFLSGTSSVFDVTAGARSAGSSTDITKYSYCQNTYLEISGKATVRHVACGTIGDGSMYEQNCVGDVFIKTADEAKVAMLLGGGYDTWYISEYSSKYGGSINIDIKNGTIGYVYGGGMRGSIGTESNPTNINITVTGGTILGDIFGGGRGGLDKAHHDPRTANPTGFLWRYDKGTSSTVGNTNSTGFSRVYGNITISIAGATIYGDVYGGGESVPAISKYMDNSWSGLNPATEGAEVEYVAAVYGSTSVSVGAGSTVKGNVYGAGKGIEMDAEGNIVLEYVPVPNYTVWNNRLTEIPYYSAIIIMDDDGNLKYIPWTQVVDAKIDNNKRGIITCYTDITGSASLWGTSSVTISGGTFGVDGSDSGNIYGGGSLGTVNKRAESGIDQSTTVTITGSTRTEIKGSVFGGGLGVDGAMAVEGDRSVYISGRPATTLITGSVYGGSRNGYDGISTDNPTSDNLISDSQIIVTGGSIGGSIFGGGLMGKTYGNTTIYMGYKVQNGTITVSGGMSDGQITVDSVYAGGNVNTSGGDDETGVQHPFSSVLVMGTGTIKINGVNQRPYISISGSIMGSGNSCNTGGETAVEILNLENGSEMAGIHRVDDLKIIGSQLRLLGRSPLVSIAGQDKDVTIYKVNTMTLQMDTNLSIEKAMDDIHTLISLNKDGDYATVKSPSNRIAFTEGSTIYVRNTDVSDIPYGNIFGFVTMAVTNTSSYGAYVIASTGSTGGMTVAQSGSFREADSSTSGDIQCWYISGTERKNVTINIQAGEDANHSPLQTYGKTFVDITKLQENTSMIYVGGTFTSESSDSNANPYSFVRPGTAAVTQEDYAKFGLAIGYRNTSDNSPSLYDPTIRSMDTGNGLKDQVGTYFSYDAYSVEGSGNETENRKLTSVDMGYLNNNGTAGSFRIHMCLVGSPVNKTSYVGYLTLNFQEVINISYETPDGSGAMVNTARTLVTNKVEVRVDIYVFGDHEDDNSYSVLMKTVKGDDGKRSGTLDVLVPSGYSMKPLYLTGTMITIDDGSNIASVSGKVNVKSIANQDRTVGWATVAETTYTPFSGTAGETPEMTSVNYYAGTLMGSLVATVEYEIDELVITYTDPDGEKDMNFTLTLGFRRSTDTGDTSAANTAEIDLKFRDKGTHKVNYRDHGIWFTEEYQEGEELTRELCREPTGTNFNGWYLDENYINRYEYNMRLFNDDLKLYARYTYVVKFDNMNGTYSEMHIAEKDKGALLNKNAVPTPTYTGYDFEGWYKDSSLIYAWDYLSDTIVENTTLYAKWTGKEVRVHFWYFDATNGGKLTLFGGMDGDRIIKVTADNNKVFDYSGSYVMDIRQGLLPTVRYGSTFSTVDPWHGSVNILEYAKEKIKTSGGFSGQFVRWQAVSPTDASKKINIYSDSAVSRTNVMLVSESQWNTAKYGYSLWNYYEDNNYFLSEYGFTRTWSTGDPPETLEINLIAATTNVAIDVSMLPAENDPFASTITIDSPSDFLVYPNGPNLDSAVARMYALYVHDHYTGDGDPLDTEHEFYMKYGDDYYPIENKNGSFRLLDKDGTTELCSYGLNGFVVKDGITPSYSTYGTGYIVNKFGMIFKGTVEDVSNRVFDYRIVCYYEDANEDFQPCVVDWDVYLEYQDDFGYIYKKYWTDDFYYYGEGSVKYTYDNVRNCWYCTDVVGGIESYASMTIDGKQKTYGYDRFYNLYLNGSFSGMSTVFLDDNGTEKIYLVKWNSNGTEASKYKLKQGISNEFIPTDDDITGYYLKDSAGNKYTYFTITPEDKTSTIELTIEGLGTETYNYDRFKNLYQNGSFADLTFVYYSAGDTETEYIAHWSNRSANTIDTLYESIGDSTYSVVDEDDYLRVKDDCYMKDRFTGTVFQLDDIDDIDSISITEDIAKYYEFIYRLNNANRNGYKLSGWHNDYVPQETAVNPSPGLVRTLRVTTEDVNNHMKVKNAVLDTMSKSGIEVIITLSGYGDKYLDKLDEDSFVMPYHTLWEAVPYSVDADTPKNGTIDAFKVSYDENTGNETREKIDKWDEVTFYYGDKIEISYTPIDPKKTQFGSWMITGEYQIDSTTKPSTTIIVQGDCSISMIEISNIVLEIMINYDGGALNSKDDLYTSVYLHDTVTNEYYAMKKVTVTTEGQLYRASVPMSDSYETCIRYGWLAEGATPTAEHPAKLESFDAYDEYKLKGNVTASVGGQKSYLYTVISARFIDVQLVTDYRNSVTNDKLTELTSKDNYNRTTFPSHDYHYPTDSNLYSYPVRILDKGGNVVVAVTKYLGLLNSDLERAEHLGQNINYPGQMTPPVVMTFEPGFNYNVYEGFPDKDGNDDIFLINVSCNYHIDKDSTTDHISTFYLNWVKNDKPADLIIHLVEQNNVTDYVNVVESYDLYSVASRTITVQSQDGTQSDTYVSNKYGRLYEGAESERCIAFEIVNGEERPFIASWSAKVVSQKIPLSVVSENVYKIAGEASGDVSSLYIKEEDGTKYNLTNISFSEDYLILTKPAAKFKLTASAGSYVGTYQLKNTDIYDASINTISGVTLDKVNGVINISLSNGAAHGGTTINLNYSNKTAKVIIEGEYPEGHPTNLDVPFGKSCVLPSELGNGTDIMGWTISVDALDDTGIRSVRNFAGIWFYDVVQYDVGKTLTFHPLTTEQITLTFVSSVGQFSNGYQRISFEVEPGQTASYYYSHGLEEIGAITTVSGKYTFNGFLDPEGNNITSLPSISESTTFTASWTAVPKTVIYTVDDEEHASVTATKGSPTVGEKGLIPYKTETSVEYQADITITIQPGSGRTLDIDKTRGELGYSLVKTYLYGTDGNGREVRYLKIDNAYQVYDEVNNVWNEYTGSTAGLYYKTVNGSHLTYGAEATQYRYSSSSGNWVTYTVTDVTGEDGPFVKRYVNASDASEVYKVTRAGVLYKKVGNDFIEQKNEIPGFCIQLDGRYYLYDSDYTCQIVGEDYYTRQSYLQNGRTYYSDTFGNVWTKEDNAYTLYKTKLFAYRFTDNKELSCEATNFNKFTIEGVQHDIHYDENGAYITVGLNNLNVYMKDQNGNHYKYNGYLYDNETIIVYGNNSGTDPYYVKEVDDKDYVKYLYSTNTMTGTPAYKMKFNGDVYNGNNEKVDKTLYVKYNDGVNDHYYKYTNIECTMVSEKSNYRSIYKENENTYYRDIFGNVYLDWMGTPRELPEGRGYEWTFMLMDSLDLMIYTKDITYSIYFVINGTAVGITDDNRVSTIYVDPETPDPYGKDIKQYYVVAFDKFDSKAQWYTDPAFTEEFDVVKYLENTTNPYFNAREYQFFANKNITLYAHSGMYVIYTHDYENTTEGTKRFEARPDNSDHITLPTSYPELEGHKFVGWAIEKTIGNDKKRVFTYAPGETIAADELSSDVLDLFAYYIKDGSKTVFYDGTATSIVVDTTGDIQYQKPLEANQISVLKYSNEPIYSTEDGQVEPTVTGITNFGTYTTYYCGVIKTAKGIGDDHYGNSLNETSFWGSSTLTVLKSDIYIIAPSKYVEGDDNTTVSVSSADVGIQGPNAESIREYIVFDTSAGHGSTLTGPGIIHTRVSVSNSALIANYNVHYIEGVIVIYTDDSSRHEYQG